MRKNLMIKKYYTAITCAILLLAGCNIPKKITQPNNISRIPEVYQQATLDSNSIATQSWKSFFADSVLQQLIDTALAFNPDLLSAAQQVNIAGTYVSMSKALTMPALDAVINLQADRYAFYTMNGVGNADLNKSSNITPDMRIPNVVPDFLIGLRSQWEIDVWGKLRNMKKSAAARYLSTVQAKRFLQTNLVAEVAYQYYELIGLDYEIEIVRKNIQLQEQALEIVRAQKLGGRATELAVLQFEAQTKRTRGIEFAVKQQIAESENRINMLLGRYPQQIKRGSSLMELTIPGKISTGIPANLLLNRPDVNAAMHDLTAAYADVAAARAMYYPSFTISPFIGFQGFRLASFFDATSIAAGIAGNITGPIFNKRRIRGQYSINEAQAKQAWLNYNKSMQTAVMEVQNSLQGFTNLASQFNLKQGEVSSLSAAIGTANDLYTNGYANYLEVITAQKSLLDAEIELTLMKKVQLQTMVALYRSAGGGYQ